jgi:Xaa-Pro aminopeptidase
MTGSSRPAGGPELQERWARAQERMEDLGIESLVVGPSPDMTYLSGFSGRQSERLALFVLPASGPPRLLVPRFEMARFAGVLSLADAVFWDDGQDPTELLPPLLPRHLGAVRIALGSELFARSVLSVAQSIAEPDFVDAAAVLAHLRIRKSAMELELLASAAAAADATMEDLFSQQLAGRTETEVAAYIRQRLVENGHDAAGHASVCAGKNAAVPHHEPTHDQIAEGPVLFDIGGSVAGYRSDTTRTVKVGEASPDLKDVYQTVRAACETATSAVRAGARACEIDAAARMVIEDAGYGRYFIHRTGHGIGLDVHEPPYIVVGNETVLEPGMVFSIEPGVYLPERFGVRIEDIVAVTEQGVKRLNIVSRELVTAI